MRYFDGTVKMQFTDLQSNGYGRPWGITRTWTNAGWAASYPGSTSGTGMVVSQQPFLVQGAGANGAEIVVVTNGWNAHFFDDHVTYFTPHYYLNESLSYNPASQHYLFTDSKGDKLSFWDFTVTGPYQRGQLDTFTDPGGNMTTTTYDPASHTLSSIQRTFTLGGTTVTEKFVYTYNASPKVTNVTLQRQINSLPWSTVRQVQYTYYTGTSSNGDQYGASGEIRSAAIKDGAGTVLDVYYYRYYNGSDNGSIGYSGGLKYYFSPQSYARLKAAGMGDPVTTDLTDAQVQNYADNYFQYTRNPSTSEEQVSLERVQGQGCACGGGNAGQGTYTFTYSTSGNAPGFNSWHYKTVETLPDNIPGVHVSQNVVYANYYGQVMLKVYQQGDAGQPPSQWATFYKYSDTGANPVGGGRTLMVASPSAIDSTFDLFHQEQTYPDLLDRNTAGDYGYLNSNTGLVTTTDYYTMTSPGISDTQQGGVAGYVQDTKIQQGQLGTPALQSSMKYFAHTGAGTVVYPVADTRVYRNPTTIIDDPANEKTKYGYTWFNNSSQMQSKTVTKPKVTAAENGPNVSDVDVTFYDSYGRPIWHMDPDGFIDYTAYDQATGAVTETITDVDYNKLSPSEQQSFDITNWTHPTSGLHLLTTMVVDGLGRTIQETSPSANDPVNRGGHVTYTIYKDSNHEARTYTWDPVANVQVGPTQVYREDRQQPTSYTESLAMTVPAHLTGGLPDGSESINDIQSLSRSFTSPGGQLVEKDDYFYLGSLSYSTAPVLPGAAAGTHYYASLYGYDARGRRDRVQSPTGTIQRTAYDGLGRVASTWVGTNDTVAAVTNTPVDLSSAFNRVGITTDGAGTLTGGLDGAGDTYPATFLHGTLTWNGLPFTLGPAGSNDAVAGGLNVTLNLPAGRDSALTLLATGVIDLQDSQPFTVTYADTSTQPFTPSLSDWWTPNNSPGESTAFTMPYYNTSNGGQVTRRNYLYAYTFLLNPAKQVQRLTLPNNPNVVVLAATLTAAPWSPTNNNPPANMVKVSDNFYDQTTIDGPSGVGDSNLTKTIRYPGGSAAARATVNVYDWRDRVVVSKQGVQATEDTSTHRPLIYTEYDNLNEGTKRQQFDADTVHPTTFLDPATGMPKSQYLSRLRAQSTTAYDDQGRAYQENTYNIVQSGPNAGTILPGTLATNKWYDHRGHVIKTSAPGGLVTKTVYDGADRATTVYTTDGAYDTAPGQSGTWTDAGNTLGDNVLTQIETTYDTDSNPILVTTRDRFHDNAPTPVGGFGDLRDPNTIPKARVSYRASYYDAADRLTDRVDFGTYHADIFTRPGTPPARSDTALVTSYGYLADTVQRVLLFGNPTGTFTLSVTIQPTVYVTGPIPVNATAATVQAALNTALAGLPNAAVQVSGPAGGPWNVRFVGSLAGTPVATMYGTAPGFGVDVGTTAEGGDTGRQQQMTDPLALVQKTDYDLLGRPTRTIDAYANFVPSNGSDRTTEYGYDGDSHVQDLIAWTVASPGAAPVAEMTQYVYGVTGSVINSNDLLNEVVYPGNGKPNVESYVYDALGEVTTRKERNFNITSNLPQTHTYTYDVLGRQTSDTVTVLGSGEDNSVLRLDTAYDTGGRPYLYTSYADTLGITVVNQVKQLYNGLGQLITEYQSHAGAVMDGTPNVQYAYTEMSSGTSNHSRLTSMTYPSGRVITHNYASGLDDAISRLTSLQSSGDSQPLEVESYLGLGTVVQRVHPLVGLNLTYIQQPGDPLANPDGGDQYTGLDRFGRVIDQFWGTTGAAADRFQYAYDRDSNVLARYNRVNGAFNEQYGYDQFNQLTSFQRGSHSQAWGLDPLGNWTQFTNDGGTPQTRDHNNQNQITAISGATVPVYDNNGNTTTDERGTGYVYDAWNRLVQATVDGTTERYAYDAPGRRVTVTVNAETSTDLYYSAGWQVLEEDRAGVLQAQYVWSPVYVDALIARDSGGIRLYVQQDANWNVTSLATPAGPTWVVRERYVYDPYGAPTVLDPDTWTARASLYNWIYLHQGGRYNSNTGLYHFRMRDYSPTLGRWMQQDPLGYATSDANLYRGFHGSPVNWTDPVGLTPTQNLVVGLEQLLKEIDEILARDSVQRSRKSSLGPLGTLWEVASIFANFTTTDKLRWYYIWCPKKCNYIDVPHFFNSAKVTMALTLLLVRRKTGGFDYQNITALSLSRLYSQLAGIRDFVKFLVQYGGVVQEYGQAINPLFPLRGLFVDGNAKYDQGEYHSAFTFEDLFSNGMGVVFAQKYWYKILAGDIRGAFSDFFKNECAKQGADCPDPTGKLPKTEQDWYKMDGPFGPAVRTWFFTVTFFLGGERGRRGWGFID